MSFDSATLQDFGELRLINEVVLPMAREFDLDTSVGDDCAYILPNGRVLAVTADVGPKPLLQSLPGYEDDLEAAGWLGVVTTASDIATAGARPLFLTNCIDAPPQLPVADFASYLRGYFKACAEFGFRNGGGDLRHGPSLAIRVFGAGVCERAYRIGRGGISPGDQLMVVGPTGRFMATYLLAAAQTDIEGEARTRLSPQAEAILRFPRPQLDEMAALADEDLVVAASDTSDSLLGAIENLSHKSHCGFELALDEALFPDIVREAARRTGLDPWNIFFAWGDWSVAVTVRPERLEYFRRICHEKRIAWTPLGKATAGAQKITARLNGGDLVSVEPVRNENFVPRGFNAGIKGHLDHILGTKLFSTLEMA
jgi:thiamin-phosphate kinase